MKLDKAIIMIVFLAMLSSIALGQNIAPVKSMLYNGRVMDAVESGNYIFAATDRNLIAIDIADSSTLLQMGGISLADTAFKIVVRNDLAYLANGHQGLQIVDISDPAHPTLAGNLTMTRASALDVQGEYAYMLNGLSGNMVIVNIAAPDSPIQTGIYQGSGSQFVDIDVYGNIACLADLAYGLRIIDTSDPAHPVYTGGFQTYQTPYAVEIRDTLVYITGGYFYGTGSFEVFNISDPHSPSLIGYQYPYFHRFIDIDISGSYAFMANWGDLTPGLIVYDISDPTNPIPAGSSYLILFPNSVSIAGDYITVTDILPGLNDIKRLSLTTPEYPHGGGAYHCDQAITNSIIYDNNLYAAGTDANIYSIDISAPISPLILDAYRINATIKRETIVGDHLYAVGNSGLIIFDISPRDSLVYVSRPLVFGINSIAVQDNYAFLAVDNGIRIFDISDPLRPDSIGRFISSGSVYDVKVRDSCAFIVQASPAALKIVNIANPINPALISELSLEYPGYALELSANYAFVADYTNGMVVVDITDITSPHLETSYPTSGTAVDIKIVGDYAYLACGDAGIIVVNIADPSHPLYGSSYDTPGEALGVTVDLPFLYVADKYSFQILHYDPTSISDGEDELPSSFSLSQNYPNPFNARTTIRYNLPENEEAILSIFDITGRQIRQLAISGEQHEIVWDGLNANGSPAASGVYFYAIQGHRQTARRMVLLR